MDEMEIRKGIRDSYSRLANRKGGCCSCKEDAPKDYTMEQLSEIPGEAAQISAGCGNPIAMVDLKEGQVVLDLGSGGGIDVFLAARKVGQKGKAIGVDATPEMVWRARETARKNEFANVKFLLGEIEHLPIESESVDVIISNCVINLSPDKRQVFSEASRVLKPGGMLAVSDIVLLHELPDIIKNNLPSWVGCVAGAALEKDYLEMIRQAGFEDIKVVERHVYTREEYESFFPNLGEREEFGKEFVKKLEGELPKMRIASSRIFAMKPKE